MKKQLIIFQEYIYQKILKRLFGDIVRKKRRENAQKIAAQNLILWTTDVTKLKAQGPIRILQKANTILLEQVINMFEQNNIKNYWLLSGSMLGSYRHKGFIPWDEDIDLAILRDDYEKVLNHFNEINNNPDLKMIKCDMIKIVHKNLPLAVDLFPFDIYPKYLETDKERNNLKAKIHKAHSQCLCRLNKKTYTGYIVNKTYQQLNKIRKELCNVESTDKKMIMMGFEYYSNVGGHLLWDYDWVYPLQKAQFENLQVNMPNKPELCLLEDFGPNYMQIPSNIEQPHAITNNLTPLIFSKLLDYVEKNS